MTRADAIKGLIEKTQQLADQLKPFEADVDQAPVITIAKAITEIQAATTNLITESATSGSTHSGDDGHD